MIGLRPAALGLALLLGAGAAATSNLPSAAAQVHVVPDTEGAALKQDPLWVRIHHMSLVDKVRQLIVPSFSGTHAPTSLIQRTHPGALIYFGGNLTSQDQTRALSTAIQHAAIGHSLPLLLMTDQEGGTVTRIPGTEGTPGGIDFHGNAAWAHNTAVRTGRLMASLGVNTNLAPVADVNTAGSGGVIGDRSFGSTPGVVSRLTTAQVCGYHSGGVATTVKHFPGHGSTDTDSHLHTAVIHESVAKWTATDLPPFQAAIAHGVDMILVGHLAFPAMDPSGRPATISRKLNFGLLRSRLHFQGVVITDALNMGGVTSWGTPAQIAVDTIKAGSDMLLMPPQPVVAVQAIEAAVRSGTIVQGRLDMSVYRVLKLKQTLGLLKPAKALSHCQ
jgi:beta-N-acetylhexosaminidase